MSTETKTDWKKIPVGTPVLFRRPAGSAYVEGTWSGGVEFYGADAAGTFLWCVGAGPRRVGAFVEPETGEWHIDPFWCKLANEVASDGSHASSVNWSEVKTGTYIYVRDDVSQHWKKRPFVAVHVSGGFLTYHNESSDPDRIEHWCYAELTPSVPDLKQAVHSEFVTIHSLYTNGQLLWEQALKMFADLQTNMPMQSDPESGAV